MKQETLEEAAERYIAEDNNNRYYNDFIEGAKWAQERSYSEKEVLEIVSNCDGSISQAKKWFEQFKNKQNCLQIK